MTVTLCLALLILGVSALLMRLRYGEQWVLRPFSMLVLAALLYHGASEVAMRFSGTAVLGAGRPVERWADEGALVAAITLLVMTIGYLVAHPARHIPTDADHSELARIFDWRLTGVLVLPLVVATVQGQGYITGNPLNGEGLGVTGFSMQFLIPVVVLTSFGLILKYPRWWLGVMLGQATVIALAGQRLEIVITAIMLAILAARVGIRPDRKQVVLAAVIVCIALIGVTSVRSVIGRDIFYGSSGAVLRLMALAQGVASPTYEGVATQNPVLDAAVRLDSNAWTGQVAQALDRGRPPVGIDPIFSSVVAMVPTVLFPAKLVSMSVYQRSPEMWITDALGMPVVDYLPAHVTYFYGALNLWQLLVFGFFVGLALGRLEYLAMRSVRPVAILGYVILLESALFFERGLPFYIYTARSFAVLAVVIWLWAKLGPAGVAERKSRSREAARRRLSKQGDRVQAEEPLTGGTTTSRSRADLRVDQRAQNG